MTILPFLLGFAMLNSCIELEVSAPSFPSIMDYFNVSENMVCLTITMNLIGFCIGSILYGPLSDAFGRRSIMLIGNGILLIGALMCVVAHNIYFLLMARFIQGLGAATSAVIVSVIISDRYHVNEATRLYGIMNAIFTTLMALAPILGGLIHIVVGWRGNYAVVAIICLISWILLKLFLPETNNNIQKYQMSQVIADYKQLITNTPFLVVASLPSLLYGCYLAFVMMSPFIYIHTLGLNLLTYSFHMSTVVASFSLTSVFAARITEYLGVKRTLTIAFSLQLAGPLLMCCIHHVAPFTINMSIFSIGFALIYPIIFAHSLEMFPS